MTTTFSVSYQIRLSNNRTQWLYTKDVNTEAEARRYYAEIINRANVIDARLLKAEDYTAEDLVPECRALFPNGKTCFFILASYSRI